MSSGAGKGSLHLQQQRHQIPVLGIMPGWLGVLEAVAYIRSQYNQYSIFSVGSVSQFHGLALETECQLRWLRKVMEQYL